MAISVSDEPVAPRREPAGRPAHDEPATARAPKHDEPGSHRTSILAGVAALVVLAGLLVLAGLALTSDASGSQQHVVFVGDSITDQARSALVAALPADDTVDVQAVPGRRFDEMLPFARQAAQSNPDQVVINLGSNDVLLGESDDVTNQSMAMMFDAFAGSPCVTVVTVNEHFVFGKDQTAHARRVNDRLRLEAAARGFSVVDWNKMVEDYEGAGSVNGRITSDSVHPSELGQRMLIDALRGSLDRCQSARTSRTT